jgi:hypothetical protein
VTFRGYAKGRLKAARYPTAKVITCPLYFKVYFGVGGDIAVILRRNRDEEDRV